MLGSGLLQPGAERRRLLARPAGQLAGGLQLVGAPDLPQDAAPVAGLVLHQEAGEAALREDHGAQERVAVEPQQRLDALVDAPHLLDLLDRLAVVAEPAQDRARLADAALTAAAQRAGDLPRLAGHPKPEHDAQVGRGVVHQLLVGLRGERRLAVQGVRNGFQNRRLARARVADDGDVVTAGEVDGRRAGRGSALPSRGRSERPQAFDGEVDGPHVSCLRRAAPGAASRRGGRASPARSTPATSGRSPPRHPARRCPELARRACRPSRGAP